jgi:hypothetical protein
MGELEGSTADCADSSAVAAVASAVAGADPFAVDGAATR